MLSKRAIRELIETAQTQPGGFIILEKNSPKLVVLDYASYQKITGVRTSPQAPVPAFRRVLVTGGAGYVGSHTARLLTQRGYEVTTFDNLSTGFLEFAQGTLVEGDLLDQERLNATFQNGNFDAVLHFAGTIDVEESVRDPEKYYRNNLIGSLNLLDSMTQFSVKTLVFSSTCAIYAGDAVMPVNEQSRVAPSSPYGETKSAVESALRWYAPAYGMRTVALRYFNPAGASFDQHLGLGNPKSTLLIPRALNVALGRAESLTVNGNDYDTQDGTAVRDYIHVLDVAEAHLLALDFLAKAPEGTFDTFNIGTGRGYSVLEVINQVCESTGRMVRFDVGPRRLGDRPNVYADITRAKRLLGFEPRFSDMKIIIDTHWAFHKSRFNN